VVITFDPIGGYGHPDHIAIHKATVKAFHASGNPLQYPSSCPAFQPQKLYFHAFPHTTLKFMVRILKLLRRDPHHFGKNKDIDLAALVETEYPVHAVIRLTRASIKARDEAIACHASQSDGPRRGIMGWVNWLFGQKDTYTRMYPPPGKKREKDLFEGIS
jgi:LmbE family N-acetylglucosaminyl deacetylase